MRRLRGLFLMDPASFDLVYGPAERADAGRLAAMDPVPYTSTSIAFAADRLAEADVILSGWGGPLLDDAFLAAAPNLKAFFYGAGSMASVLTDAVWRRGLAVSSAIEANGTPVAEYALATTLFSLKHGWRLAREARARRTFTDRDTAPGAYGTTVGLVSLGVIGRAFLKLLAPFDLRTVAYDPFLTARDAAALGVEPAPLLDVFRRSDVVSLHTPHLAETEGMITGEHFAAMKHGATFINTARAAVVRQADLIDVAARRPDLQFVLDVADPEPPEPQSPLYDLPNVVLTPHMAGSVGGECRRMGRYMVEELERFVAGKPLRWAVTPELTRHTSHRPVRRTSLPPPQSFVGAAPAATPRVPVVAAGQQ